MAFHDDSCQIIQKYLSVFIAFIRNHFKDALVISICINKEENKNSNDIIYGITL